MQQSKREREIKISTSKPNRNINLNHKHGFNAKQIVLYYTYITHPSQRLSLRKPIGLNRADYVRNTRRINNTTSVLTQICQWLRIAVSADCRCSQFINLHLFTWGKTHISFPKVYKNVVILLVRLDECHFPIFSIKHQSYVTYICLNILRRNFVCFYH